MRALVRTFAYFVLVATIAACTRTDMGNGPAGGNSWTRHGILRIVDLSEPDSLNPVVGSSQIDNDLSDLWAGKFFEWSDKNALVPDLVTTVPSLANGDISKDERTYVYHLRPGVFWQDGPKFTADDVVFTWHAIMNKKNNVSNTVGFDDIASIDVRDPLTIAVHLKKPFAPFVATFFGPSTSPFPVLPKHLLAKFDNINQVAYNSAPIGTGAFTVDRWQRGSKIVFRANPHYWRGAPKLKEIWYTPIPSENTVVTQLKSHDADVDEALSATAYSAAQNIPGYSAHLTPFDQFDQIAINTRSPILREVAVRRALWYATDTERLVRTVGHGVNVVGFTDQATYSWAYNPNVPHYGFDLAKARALLEAAGWHVGRDGIRMKNGRRLSIAIAGITGSGLGDAMDVQLQSQWREIGIDVGIKSYTTALLFATYGAGGILNTGKFDVALYGWLPGADPDDSNLWMCDQIPPGGQNISGYCNPKLDALERVALASSDRAVRKKAYDGIQATLAADVPAIVVFYVRRVSIVNDDVKGWAPASSVSSFWNCYDWST